MGCGSSSANQVYEPETAGYKGPVNITVKHAVLTRDVNFIDKMDPYVVLKMGDQTYKTPQHVDAGKYPKWTNAFTTFRKKINLDDVIVGQVWTENPIVSDVLIGEGAFSLTKVRKGNTTPQEINFKIYFNGKLAGTVTVEVIFSLDPAGLKLPEIRAPDTTGKLIFEPKEATLKRNVNVVLNMDPLVSIRMGDETLSSAVNMGGHLTPKWIDKLILTREKNEDILCIECWSFSDFGSNDLIGIGYASITEALSLKEKIMKQVPLFFDSQKVGEITFVYTYITDDPENYFPDGENFDQYQGKTQENQQKLNKMPQQLQRFASTVGKKPQNRQVPVFQPEEEYQEEPHYHQDEIDIPQYQQPQTQQPPQQVYQKPQQPPPPLYQPPPPQQHIPPPPQQQYPPPPHIPPPQMPPSQMPPPQQPYVQHQPPQGYPGGPPQFYPGQQPPPQMPPQQPYAGQNYPPQPMPYAQFPAQYPQVQVYQNQKVTFTYPNGDIYQGDYVNNQRNGTGRMTYINGGYYEGEFFQDLIHGKGELQQGDVTYKGRFKNGKKDGFGIATWQNGQKYEGSWQNNNMHGEGEWTFPNGAKKKGQWMNGMRFKWMDDETNTIYQGKTIPTGGLVHSPSGQFTLTLAYDGKLVIFNNANKIPIFKAEHFNRMIQQPFFMRLEGNGELVLIDGSGSPYFTSGQPSGRMGPFMAKLQDDGRLCVQDANGQIIWYSH